MRKGKLIRFLSGSLIIELENGDPVRIPIRNAPEIPDSVPGHLRHEVRTLKWKLKSLGKQLGRSGETIHNLRAENALLREQLRYATTPQRFVPGLGSNDVPKEAIRHIYEEPVSSDGGYPNPMSAEEAKAFAESQSGKPYPSTTWADQA